MFQPQPTLASYFSSPFVPSFPSSTASPARQGPQAAQALPVAVSDPAVNLNTPPASSQPHLPRPGPQPQPHNRLEDTGNPHDSSFNFATSVPSPAPFLLGPHTPFGYYFDPVALQGGCAGSGLATELVGLGSRAASAEAAITAVGGAPGAGVSAAARRGTSRGSTPATSTTFTKPATQLLRCDGSLSHNTNNRLSQQHLCPSAAIASASRQIQNPDRQQQAHPQLRRPRQQQQQSQRQRQGPSPARIQIKMEDQQDPHGMAAQQAAAQNYQPDLPNYLVGEKTPSDAITNEYAKADQAYVEKTVALPQTYSHFRPIAGDGNCGWRAIGFAYFEKLIETGDPTRFTREVERLVSENPRLGDVGGYDYYEDFADQFFDTLKDIGSNVENPPVAHAMLHQRWNDADTTAGMIFYMRLLAATFLKSESERFDPFIADSGGVAAYCNNSVEVINREIEHLGIVALSNVLLAPNHFILEIAYLDRSPGSQVTTYRLPDEANNQDASNLGPIIYLLYRPDHYDILYREHLPQQVHNDIQVLRVSNMTDNAGISSHPMDLNGFSTNNFDALQMIPGLTNCGGLAMPPGGGPPVSDAFTPSQQHNAWFGLTDSTPTPPQPQVVTPGPPPNPSLSPNVIVEPRAPPGLAAQPGMMPGASPECTIRFSQVQLEYDGGKMGHPEPFQVTTSTFKNSVWNRAHFGNPDFHPEEWSPEDEAMDGRLGSRRKGSRKE